MGKRRDYRAVSRKVPTIIEGEGMLMQILPKGEFYDSGT
jgi:hypothetical protein